MVFNDDGLGCAYLAPYSVFYQFECSSSVYVEELSRLLLDIVEDLVALLMAFLLKEIKLIGHLPYDRCINIRE